MEKKCWNAIWISDVHLGTRGCKATQLHAFLKANTCEKLYLVGDIIDGWRIATSKWYWPGEHNKVVRQILRKAEKEGTKVFYIPGNHDEFLREYIAEHQFHMGNVVVVDEAFHTTANGERLWIIHGDAYDGVTRHHRWVALLGDAGYNFLLISNRWFNQLRKLLHLPYWSLSAAIKNKVKKAVNFIFDFEHTVARETAKRGFDGVICGHIHHASKKQIDGINYYNCGDWVESCTALAEDAAGNIDIIHWAELYPLADNVIPLKLPVPAQAQAQVIAENH
ncbi:MAG: UDP-2,3-diacylglucosamine diphosphatase [Pseudomonadota bacterium]